MRASRLVGDAAVLYAAHALGLIMPLLTVPYLARVLRPTGWGLVIFAQSLGAWLALIIEYGFDLSGTRSVARSLGDESEISEVVAGIQGARTIIVLVLMPVVALLVLVPAFRSEPALLIWAFAFAVARGVSPAWYFFGVQRMRSPAILDAAAKVFAALGVFVWVRAPADGWRVLALQAVFMALSVAWMTGLMYRHVRVRLPSPTASVRALRQGSGIFVFRGASGIYYQANSFILGLLGTPQVVAFFGSAEKIVRAGIGMYQPLTQALFPRMSHLTETSTAGATRLLRLGLVLFGTMGVGLAAVVAGAAPLLVDVLLGPGYEAAVPVLRLLGLLPLIIAVGTLFGIHWALPSGLERPFYTLVIVAGVLNVAFASLLVPRFGAMGMACAVIVAEVLVAVGLVVVFRSKGGKLWPFKMPEASERA